MLETPITGGNVSFYNETLGKPIYPTPILGVLGLMEDAECALGSAFRNEGDVIVLLDAGRSAMRHGRNEASDMRIFVRPSMRRRFTASWRARRRRSIWMRRSG